MAVAIAGAAGRGALLGRGRPPGGQPISGKSSLLAQPCPKCGAKPYERCLYRLGGQGYRDGAPTVQYRFRKEPHRERPRRASVPD